MKIPKPVIYEVDYTNDDLSNLKTTEQIKSKKDQKLIFNYPTVYIVNDEVDSSKYSVYVGETTDIKRRTSEHLSSDPKTREDWKALLKSERAKMFVIGHEHFNKSLTLDI